MFWFLLFSALMAAEEIGFEKDTRIEVVLKSGARFFAYCQHEVGEDWVENEVLLLRLESGQSMRIATKNIQGLKKVEKTPVVVSFKENPRPTKKETTNVVFDPSRKQYFVSPSVNATGGGSGSLNQRMLATTLSIGIGDKVSAHAFAIPIQGADVWAVGARYTYSLSDNWFAGASVYTGSLFGNVGVLGLGSVGYRAENYKLEMDLGFAPSSYDNYILLNLKGQVHLLPRLALMSETFMPMPIDCYGGCYFYGDIMSINGARLMFGSPSGGFGSGALGLDVGILSLGYWDLDYGVENSASFLWLGLGWYY